MIYSSVLGAVVSALAAEAIDNTSKQAWQKLYDANEENQRDLASLAKSAGVGLSRDLVDNWVSARLRHMLIHRHWQALNAKYSTNKARVVEAIGHLRPLVATPATQLFLFKAVTAWAVPKLPGAKSKRAASVSVEVPLDLPDWRRNAMVRDAVLSVRSTHKTEESRGAGVIILPDSFYDMNTWDTEGRPESTRREWRRNIHKVLDEMVSEALAAAEQVLEEEGLIIRKAA